MARTKQTAKKQMQQAAKSPRRTTSVGATRAALAAAAQGGVAKEPRRAKQGMAALREIRRLQMSTAAHSEEAISAACEANHWMGARGNKFEEYGVKVECNCGGSTT